MRRETSLISSPCSLLSLHVRFPCAAQNVLFSDSSRYYVFTESKGLKAEAVRDYLRRTGARSRVAALKTLFDSLGFFEARISSRDKDTVDVVSGPRTMVDTLRLVGSVPVTMDSVIKVKLPRPYDEGEIRSIAKKAVYVLGTKGYPFATLSVALGAPAPGRGISMVLSVRTNGQYAFSKPLFTGNIKTSRKLLAHDVVFRDGEVFDLRKVDQSRLRLMLRPYITGVDVAPPAIVLDAAAVGPAIASAPSLDKVLVPFVCQDQTVSGSTALLPSRPAGLRPQAIFPALSIYPCSIFFTAENRRRVSYNGTRDYSKLAFSLAKPYLLDVPYSSPGISGSRSRPRKTATCTAALDGLRNLPSCGSWGWASTVTRYGTPAARRPNTGAWTSFFRVRQERQVAGAYSRSLVIRTGSGLAHNNGRQFDRWHVDVSGGMQVPVTSRQAMGFRAVAQSLFTQPDDSLQTVELYRTGGYQSIRGYSDNEFAFKSVLMCRLNI